MPGPLTHPNAVVPSTATTTSIRLKPGEMPSLKKSTNWVQLPDGSIETLVGPTPMDPNRGQGYPTASLGYAHGMFHVRMANGMVDMLLLRAGSQLYRHAGWSSGKWESLKTGLSDEQRGCFPDTFILVNDRVVWCNGVDAPVVIDYLGEVYGFGFSDPPPAPTAIGPDVVPQSAIGLFYPNAARCWPGGKGTSSDILTNNYGLILDGMWRYYAVYQDYFGNRSPASEGSNAVYITQMSTEPFTADATDETCHRGDLDLLRKQLHATMPAAPNNVRDRIKQVDMFVTRDMGSGRNTGEAYLFRSIGGTGAVSTPDDTPDGLLSVKMPNNVGVSPYRVACVHNGVARYANFTNNPLMIREAEPNFPGTWPADRYIVLSGGGGEVTGMVSHAGRCIAFTRNTMFDVTSFDPGAQRTIAEGIGCCAPRSIKATPEGVLIWLSDKGFYAMTPDMMPKPISIENYDDVRRKINYGFAIKADACYDPANGEYLMTVAPAGHKRNRIIWRWNGKGWRHYDFGWSVAAMCVSDDRRQLVFIAGADEDTSTNHVGVLHHESPMYTAPDRQSILRTQMIRPLEFTTMFRVREIQVEVYDATDDTVINVYGYKNDIWAEDVGPISMTAFNPPRGVDVAADEVGSAVIGTAKVRESRALWRFATLDMEDCASFAIGIEVDYPNYVRIGNIVVTAEPVSGGGPIGRMADNQEM